MSSPPPVLKGSHFIPFLLLLPLLLPLFLCSVPSTVLSVNVTTLLAPYPDLSAFAHLLAATSVAGDLARRSSLTLLAVPNPVLLRPPTPRRSTSGGNLDLGAAAAAASPGDVADVLRYHVLLEYLSPADLRRIPPEGRLVATLYQTTGRAAGDRGSVKLMLGADGAVTVRPPDTFAPSNATILALVTALPYNVSVFTVDSLVVPYGFDLAAAENQPPLGLNITGVLVDGRDFNVAASMLEASGVAAELEQDEKGAGITMFVPTDEAFAALPGTERVQSLPADRKAAVLRFHVLHSYYPLGSLEGIVNPVQPTLATEGTGAGWFTLNISRVNGSLAIDTGVVQASITRTVFDQNPVAVFGVSKVLLPREIFGGRSASGAKVAVPPPPPEEVSALIPEGAPDTPPARLSAPPGLREGAGSGEGSGAGIALAGGGRGGSSIVLFCCIEILVSIVGMKFLSFS